jgi:hypothetical protein
VRPDLDLSPIEPGVTEAPAAGALPTGAASQGDATPPPFDVTPAPDGENGAGSSRSPWRAGAWAGVGAAVGVVPSAAPLFEVGLTAGPAPWSASIAGRALLGRRETTEGRSVEVSALGARLAAGYAPIATVHIALGLDADRLSGEGGSGVPDRRSDVAWDLAPAAEVAVIPHESEHFRLSMALGGRLSLLRPQFEVTGFGTVYRVPPAAAFATIRGAWLFL